VCHYHTSVRTFAVTSPYLHRAHFVEFTTRIDKNTALFYLFAALAFLFSLSHSRCSRRLPSLMLFTVGSHCYFLSSLVNCRCFCHCSRCFYLNFFLVVALVTHFRRCFLVVLIAFFRRCSRRLPSVMLFTLVVTLSTRHSHCLFYLCYSCSFKAI